MGKIKQDVPCQECGEPKAKWTYGHPEMMQKVFGLGPTENVRLCAKCQAKYERGTVADDGKTETPVDDYTPLAQLAQDVKVEVSKSSADVLEGLVQEIVKQPSLI